MTPEQQTAVRQQFAQFLQDVERRPRLEARARAILKRKTIGTGVSAVEIRLRRNGPGRYVLADHIGVPRDTPDNVDIETMIAWLEAQPDRPSK